LILEVDNILKKYEIEKRFLKMENIIVKDDIVLGFTKEVKKYFVNEINKLALRYITREVDEVEEIAGNIEEIRDLLKELEKEDEEELICVEMNPMGSFFYNRVAVYTREKSLTREKRLILL
jgi:hypothetical protein